MKAHTKLKVTEKDTVVRRASQSYYEDIVYFLKQGKQPARFDGKVAEQRTWHYLVKTIGETRAQGYSNEAFGVLVAQCRRALVYLLEENKSEIASIVAGRLVEGDEK